MKIVGQQCLDIVLGDPEGDLRRRVTNGCARCYVLATDHPTSDTGTLWSLTDPPTDPSRHGWSWRYRMRIPDCNYVMDVIGRKAVIERIRQGKIGIEDRLGVWNGEFWHGLKLSGTLRRGPGTEFYMWEKPHLDLIADMAEMPLMKRLEPKASKGGLRRLRRCYAAFLPADDPLGRSVLAGLFAGAILRVVNGETWMELPDNQGVRSVLADWGIPYLPLERIKGRHLIRVSPLFAMLVAHLMPPRSAARIHAIGRAGGCPYLSVVLWEMAMTKKNNRYLPFPDAVPFGCSKATFFRKGWHRRDLCKAGWLDLGIRIPTKLRDLMVDWHQRRTSKRLGHDYDPLTYPVPPNSIPAQRFPPVAPDVPSAGAGQCRCWEKRSGRRQSTG